MMAWSRVERSNSSRWGWSKSAENMVGGPGMCVIRSRAMSSSAAVASNTARGNATAPVMSESIQPAL